MAKVIESKKGFKLIQCTTVDVAQVFGGAGICDRCNDAPQTGVYIAVLNAWYCKKCFEDWHETATNHESDRDIENKNFEHYKPLFEENDKNNGSTILLIEQNLEKIQGRKNELKGGEFVIVEPIDLLCCVVEPGTGVNGTDATISMSDAKFFESEQAAEEQRLKTNVFNGNGKIEFIVMPAEKYFEALEKRNNDLIQLLKNE